MGSALFSPLQIGGMTVRNRTFMAPMSLGYESEDGTVTERMQEYWLARAKGGVGCVILDALSVDPSVPYLGNTLCFKSEKSVNAYREFTQKLHALGAKVIPQITHPGPESISAFYGVPPVASSCYLNSMGQKTRALGIEELPGIVEQYAQTSYLAQQAGFDGIELHCAHAYMLLGSFLSPMRNKRTDAYGGSLDNRARLLFEVIDAIKARCGKEFPIVLRVSGSERDEQGNTLDDMLYLLPKLEAHGIDAFEISGGTQYERCNKIIPCHGEHQGVNVAEAKAIKAAASVPVIVVGKIIDPTYAMHLADTKAVDGIVFGRALLSDPEMVNKAEAGLFEQIAPCSACGIGCIGEQTKRKPASCVINPALGRERELALNPTDAAKTVVVIGGGIGGMAAARAFAVRGDRVILLEKGALLGGQINVANIPPHKQEISKWICYLNSELTRLCVEVLCNTCADEALVDSLRPDVVLIATGSKEILPPVPGVPVGHAITAQKVLRNEIAILGGNVLVVGGGMVGCEVCEHLLAHKAAPMQVTIIEMADTIGAGMVPNNLLPTMQRLNALGVQMKTNCKLCSVEGGKVTVDLAGVPATMEGFTHIVYACGSKADAPLYEQLRDRYPVVRKIGDAAGARQALEAVREGWEAAVQLG